MEAGVVHGGRCGAWRQVWCMEAGVVHGGRCGAWGQVWCMGAGVVHGGRCGAWRQVWCIGAGVHAHTQYLEPACLPGTAWGSWQLGVGTEGG